MTVATSAGSARRSCSPTRIIASFVRATILSRARGGLHRFTGWRSADPHRLRQVSSPQSGPRRRPRTWRRSGRISTAAAPLLTPESVVDIQARLGSDVAMIFDECPSWPATREDPRRWSGRCGGRAAAAIVSGAGHRRPASSATPSGQAQFGIVQGGTFKDLRDCRAPGTLAPGFSRRSRLAACRVGEPVEDVRRRGSHGSAATRRRPRYLMGRDARRPGRGGAGIDLFDCVLPTRKRAERPALHRTGRLNIKNARYAEDLRPPDAECTCPTCRAQPRLPPPPVYVGRADRGDP